MPTNTFLCDNCGQRPPVVRVLLAQAGQPRPVALCEVCAEQLRQARGGQAPQAPGQQAGQASPLDEFGRDLTQDAAEGRIDPVVGRAEEIEQTVEILARRRKNNAVLIGEAGVGKTASSRASRCASRATRSPRRCAAAASWLSTSPAWSPARSTAASSSSA